MADEPIMVTGLTLERPRAINTYGITSLITRINKTVGRLVTVLEGVAKMMDDVIVMLIQAIDVQNTANAATLSFLTVFQKLNVNAKTEYEKFLYRIRHREPILIRAGGTQLSVFLPTFKSMAKNITPDIHDVTQVVSELKQTLSMMVNALDPSKINSTVFLGAAYNTALQFKRTLSEWLDRVESSRDPLITIQEFFGEENIQLLEDFMTTIDSISSSVMGRLFFTLMGGNKNTSKVIRRYSSLRRTFKSLKKYMRRLYFSSAFILFSLGTLVSSSGNFQAAAQIAEVRFQILGMTIGGSLTPAITVLTELLRAVMDWYDAQPEPVKRAIIVTILLTVVIIVIAAFIIAINTVTFPAQLIIVGIAIVILAIVAVLNEFGLKMMGMDDDRTVLSFVIDGAMSLMDDILTGFVEFSDDLITSAINFVEDFFVAPAVPFVDALMGFFDLIGSVIADPLGTAFSVLSDIGDFVSSIDLAGMGGDFVDQADNMISALWDVISNDLMGFLLEGMIKGGEDVIDFIISTMTDFVMMFVDAIASLLGDVVGGLVDLLGGVINSVISSLVHVVSDVIGGLWDAIVGIVNGLIDAYNDSLGTAVGRLDRLPKWKEIIGSFATGGPIPQTGLAVLHEGEYVIPRSGAPVLRERSSPKVFKDESFEVIVEAESLDYFTVFRIADAIESILRA